MLQTALFELAQGWTGRSRYNPSCETSDTFSTLRRACLSCPAPGIVGGTAAHGLAAALFSQSFRRARSADGFRVPGNTHPTGACRCHPPEMDVRRASASRYGLD